MLSGMTMTTIKVPKSLRNRLHRLAAADGLTLAQEIDKLIGERVPRPTPTIGGSAGPRRNRPANRWWCRQ